MNGGCELSLYSNGDRFWSSLATVALLSCLVAVPAKGATWYTNPIPSGVVEAIVDHHFRSDGRSGSTNTVTCFLQVNAEDPSPDVLRRLKEHRPPIRPFSEFTYDATGHVWDAASNRPGIVVHVEDLKHLGETSVSVSGGHAERRGERVEALYTLARTNHVAWSVIGTKIVFPPTVCERHRISLSKRVMYGDDDGVDSDPTREYIRFMDTADGPTAYPHSTPWYASESPGGTRHRPIDVLVCPECDRQLEHDFKRFREAGDNRRP